jgi:hypothetical protein
VDNSYGTMIKHDVARLTLTFRPTDAWKNDSDSASAFWQYVAEHTDRKLLGDDSLRRREQVVLSKFGIRLRENILEWFGHLGRKFHPEFEGGSPPPHYSLSRPWVSATGASLST